MSKRLILFVILAILSLFAVSAQAAVATIGGDDVGSFVEKDAANNLESLGAFKQNREYHGKNTDCPAGTTCYDRSNCVYPAYLADPIKGLTNAFTGCYCPEEYKYLDGESIIVDNGGSFVGSSCTPGEGNAKLYKDFTCSMGFEKGIVSGINAEGCTCPSGRFIKAVPVGNACDICPAGFMCYGGGKFPCPAGKYQDNVGGTICYDCPEGYYSTGASSGTPSCTACEGGKTTTDGINCGTKCSNDNGHVSVWLPGCNIVTCKAGYQNVSNECIRCAGTPPSHMSTEQIPFCADLPYQRVQLEMSSPLCTPEFSAEPLYEKVCRICKEGFVQNESDDPLLRGTYCELDWCEVTNETSLIYSLDSKDCTGIKVMNDIIFSDDKGITVPEGKFLVGNGGPTAILKHPSTDLYFKSKNYSYTGITLKGTLANLKIHYDNSKGLDVKVIEVDRANNFAMDNVYITSESANVRGIHFDGNSTFSPTFDTISPEKKYIHTVTIDLSGANTRGIHVDGDIKLGERPHWSATVSDTNSISEASFDSTVAYQKFIIKQMADDDGSDSMYVGGGDTVTNGHFEVEGAVRAYKSPYFTSNAINVKGELDGGYYYAKFTEGSGDIVYLSNGADLKNVGFWMENLHGHVLNLSEGKIHSGFYTLTQKGNRISSALRMTGGSKISGGHFDIESEIGNTNTTPYGAIRLGYDYSSLTGYTKQNEISGGTFKVLTKGKNLFGISIANDSVISAGNFNLDTEGTRSAGILFADDAGGVATISGGEFDINTDCYTANGIYMDSGEISGGNFLIRTGENTDGSTCGAPAGDEHAHGVNMVQTDTKITGGYFDVKTIAHNASGLHTYQKGAPYDIGHTPAAGEEARRVTFLAETEGDNAHGLIVSGSIKNFDIYTKTGYSSNYLKQGRGSNGLNLVSISGPSGGFYEKSYTGTCNNAWKERNTYCSSSNIYGSVGGPGSAVFKGDQASSSDGCNVYGSTTSNWDSAGSAESNYNRVLRLYIADFKNANVVAYSLDGKPVNLYTEHDTDKDEEGNHTGVCFKNGWCSKKCLPERIWDNVNISTYSKNDYGLVTHSKGANLHNSTVYAYTTKDAGVSVSNLAANNTTFVVSGTKSYGGSYGMNINSLENFSNTTFTLGTYDNNTSMFTTKTYASKGNETASSPSSEFNRGFLNTVIVTGLCQASTRSYKSGKHWLRLDDICTYNGATATPK